MVRRPCIRRPNKEKKRSIPESTAARPCTCSSVDPTDPSRPESRTSCHTHNNVHSSWMSPPFGAMPSPRLPRRLLTMACHPRRPFPSSSLTHCLHGLLSQPHALKIPHQHRHLRPLGRLGDQRKVLEERVGRGRRAARRGGGRDDLCCGGGLLGGGEGGGLVAGC